jgi:hypothetical protein
MNNNISSSEPSGDCAASLRLVEAAESVKSAPNFSRSKKEGIGLRQNVSEVHPGQNSDGGTFIGRMAGPLKLVAIYTLKVAAQFVDP